jgi:hypothetical protein
MKRILLLLLFCLIGLVFFSFDTPSFKKKILNNVRSCVEYNAEFQEKKALFALLEEVEENFCVEESGGDELRVKFVNLQGCFEHTLACFQALGEIDQLVGIIHTPLPATPLCIKPNSDVSSILDPSIRKDRAKLLTVRSRAETVREFLEKGGKLYTVYPKGGLEKRSLEQQKNYLSELKNFPQNLVDSVLATSEFADDKVGATYLFRNAEQEVYLFSVKSYQANDIRTYSEWGLWFGPLKEKALMERANEIFDYLKERNGPDVRKDYL